MSKILLAAAAALLILAGPAWAQYDGGGSAGSRPPSAIPAPAMTNNFEKLPAGDRKIARALFMAQRPTRSGPAPLSLSQIADLKARGNWAKVFSQMQARGLIQAKSLGQVVSGYERQQRRSDVRSSGEPERAATLVTSGSGSVVASSRRAGAGMSHGGDVTGETNTTVDIAAADRRDRDNGRLERRDRTQRR